PALVACKVKTLSPAALEAMTKEVVSPDCKAKVEDKVAAPVVPVREKGPEAWVKPVMFSMAPALVSRDVPLVERPAVRRLS
ncbi:MAG: hypothetical protein Q8P71_02930, partial [bacterium]|nr:hypothetical protein [bacterium]